MTVAKGPILLVAGGCAAMLGAAVLTVSLGSFFEDLPTSKANAASASGLPVKVVKTVSLTPKQAAPEPANTEPARTEPRPAATEARISPPAPSPKATSAVSAATDDTDLLHQTDPRWARQETASNAQKKAAERLESAYADDGSARASQAATAELGSGGVPLAMLGSDEEQAGQVAAKPREESEEPQQRVSGRSVAVNDAVNMRAAPRSGSRVILVVPDGAKVSMAAGCKDWCRVSYDGRTGYIYRSFVAGGSAPKKQVRRASMSQQQQDETQPVKPSEEAGLFGNSGVFNNSGSAAAAKAKTAVAQEGEKKPVLQSPRGGQFR